MDYYFIYSQVFIPALGTTYIPSKFSRTTEEAQCAAAEYSLIQLGYPLEGKNMYMYTYMYMYTCDCGLDNQSLEK